MGTGKQYRARIEVESSSETGEGGERVIHLTIRGEKKLFDATGILEERGAVLPLTARIERAVKDEIVTSLREVDEFFKLVRSRSSRKRNQNPAITESTGNSKSNGTQPA